MKEEIDMLAKIGVFDRFSRALTLEERCEEIRQLGGARNVPKKDHNSLYHWESP